MFRVIFLLVVVVHVATSAKKIATNKVDSAIEYWRHANRVNTRKFPCKTPLKRMVSLREIVGDEEFDLKYKKIIHKIKPFGGSILARCQNSGCCTNYNQPCGVENENILKLTFGIEGDPFNFFTVSAANHTSCACQTIGDNFIK